MNRSSPWLLCVVLTCMACAGGPGWRARQSKLEALLAESRAALVDLDWERAQELADEATRLSPDSTLARTWRGLLLEGASPWAPPELRQPPSAPGPHVVPGALLFVTIPSLPLVDSPTLEEAADSLPLGAAVSVLGVEGGWAHVRRVGVSGLMMPGAPPRWSARPLPAAALASEGHVDARFLAPAPVDLGELRQRVRTLLAEGSREEALTRMELLLFADPWDEELSREMHRLALELERIPAAVRASRVATGKRPSAGLSALEGRSLLYGCRGDVLTAERQTEHEAGPEPVEACVTDVDVSPPLEVLAIAVCSFVNPQDEEAWAHHLRASENAAERQRQDELRHQEEWRAYHERLGGLREHYPEGPFLCVTVSHTGEGASWNVPVQLYSMPSDGQTRCSYSADEPEQLASPLVGGLQLDELRLPYLAPGDEALVCRRVPAYADMFFGALLAPDVKSAADFVSRREEAQFAADDSERSDDPSEEQEELSDISEEPPNVRFDTAFGPRCNLDCY